MLPEKRFTSDAPSEPVPASAEPLYADVFLVSLAVILLGISYTRIFSFKLWFVAPDSYAMNAASAGAFILSESYLLRLPASTNARA